MHQNTLDGRAPLGELTRSPDTLAAMGPTSKGYRRKGEWKILLTWRDKWRGATYKTGGLLLRGMEIREGKKRDGKGGGREFRPQSQCEQDKHCS